MKLGMDNAMLGGFLGHLIGEIIDLAPQDRGNFNNQTNFRPNSFESLVSFDCQTRGGNYEWRRGGSSTRGTIPKI